MECKKCGAEIKRDAIACSYCGWMNYEGAEKAYFESLNDIKEDLEELEYEPEKAYESDVKQMGKSVGKSIVRIVIVLLVLFALAMAFNRWVLGL